MTKLQLAQHILGLLEGLVVLDPANPDALATEDDFARIEKRLSLIIQAFRQAV